MIAALGWWGVWLVTGLGLVSYGAVTTDYNGYPNSRTGEQRTAARLGLAMVITNPLILGIALVAAATP